MGFQIIFKNGNSGSSQTFLFFASSCGEGLDASYLMRKYTRRYLLLWVLHLCTPAHLEFPSQSQSLTLDFSGLRHNITSPFFLVPQSSYFPYYARMLSKRKLDVLGSDALGAVNEFFHVM